MKKLTATLCLTLTVLLESAEESWDAEQNGLREFQTRAIWGDAEAMFNLGVMYQYGLDIPQDNTAAVKWYTRATDHGHADAQNNH